MPPSWTDELVGLLFVVYERLRPDPVPGRREVELTMHQLRALLLLHRNGAMTMRTLAAELGITPSSSTSLVDRLASKGLAARGRDTNDRRRVLCRATRRGLSIVDGLRRMSRARVHELVRELGPDRTGDVIAAMRMLADAGEALDRGSSRSSDRDQAISGRRRKG